MRWINLLAVAAAAYQAGAGSLRASASIATVWMAICIGLWTDALLRPPGASQRHPYDWASE